MQALLPRMLLSLVALPAALVLLPACRPQAPPPTAPPKPTTEQPTRVAPDADTRGDSRQGDAPPR